MSFNLQVKIDAGATVPTLDKVQAGLAAVEKQGAVTERAAIALGKSLAASVAAVKPDQVSAASRAFAGMNDQFKRNADMLERINGPMREYNEGQRTAEMLYRNNQISAEQYRLEVERLNASIEKTPKHQEEHEGFKVEGSVGKAVAGQFGEAGNVAAGIGAGTLEVAGVVGLAAEVVRLGDEYTNLANKAVRFVDAGHDVNTILSDQMALSRDIHGGLEQTVELYSQIREGTDELNYSYRDQITVTKSLAEEVQLSGKSLDQSSGLMQRLAFAFESGTITGRELKGMMRDFPALGETLRSSFGKTSAELMKMANHGTLAPQMILDALIEKAPEIEERFGKMAETSAQKWGHFKDEMMLAIGDPIPSIKEMQRQLAALEPPEVRAIKAMEDLKKKTEETLSPVALIAARLQEISNKARENATYAAISEKGVAAEVERMKAEAAARKDAIYDRDVKKAQADAVAAYNKEVDEEQKILDRLSGGTKESFAEHTALDNLYKKHTITLSQYNAELDRMAIKAADPAFLKLVDDATSTKQPKDRQLQSEVKQRTEQKVEDDYWNDGKSLSALQKWNLEMEQLNALYAKGGHSQAEYASKKREFDEAYSNDADVKKQTEAAKHLASEEARINTDKWKAEIEGQKKHQAEMVSALKPLEDGILQMVETGKMDFQGMIDSWIKSLEAAALHKLVEGLAGDIAAALGGDIKLSGTPGASVLDGGHHATGGSYTAPPGGGVDSHAVMFRMSPGETAYFTPQGQQQAQASAGTAPAPIIKIVNQHDTRGELLDTIGSGAADAHIINVMRRNPGAVKALLR